MVSRNQTGNVKYCYGVEQEETPKKYKFIINAQHNHKPMD